MHHPGVHDSTLVLLSILIAVVASYTALDLAARMRAGSGLAKSAWLGAAALAMGGGIWSMHFVAMLAFSLPGMEVTYDLALTLVSLVLPIAVTAMGFWLVSKANGGGRITLALSGLLMGLGIAGMHYTGMAAMRMQADLGYSHFWVAVSLLIAVGAATAALSLAIRQASFRQRLLAAPVMGIAIAGMHYAAMQGASFTAYSDEHVATTASVGQTHLAVWVATTTLLILLLGIVAASIDRSFAQQLQTEALARSASEQRFRLLVQGVADYAIFMLDPQGHVTNWNTGAQRIHGYSEGEIVGQHFSRFYTEEDQERGLARQALETAAREERFEHEGWRIRKDATCFMAHVVIDAIRDENGQLLGFAKVTRDVTELRRSQQELEEARVALTQAQKIETIGQLTGGVAHDFNNLLAVIMGNLDLMRRRVKDPQLLKFIDNSLEAAKRGASLTGRMLAFARRQALKTEPIDVLSLVHSLSNLLERSIGPTIQIRTEFPLRLPRALADANQLELAILNLVVNARDAMPQGGTITMSAELKSEAGASFVALTVEDAGTGMDAETLAKAIEPFFTTKGVGKGTGLGLSMVHGMAEQLGGRFELSSEAGIGTKATILLPIASGDQADEPPATPTSEIRGVSPLTVLVVDDDDLVLANTTAMLEDLGHTVFEAASGEQGLRLLGGESGIQLVITDQLMPGMLGTQLASAIRKRWPEMPVLLTTGYSELPPGSDPTLPKLSKPFTQADLARELARIERPQGPSHPVPAQLAGRTSTQFRGAHRSVPYVDERATKAEGRHGV
jgi:PAS domain S-box-containing protein